MLLFVCAALGLIAAGAVGEWVARRIVRSDQRHLVFTPGARRDYLLDPAALPGLTPLVRVRINQDGERGPVRSGSGHCFRVLVCGGSTAECLYIDQAKTWPAVALRELSASATLRELERTCAHVGSIAKSGLSSAGVVKILHNVFSGTARFDAIVLMTGPGDVINWLQGGALSPHLPEPSWRQCFEHHPRHTFGVSPRSWATAELWRRHRLATRPEYRQRVGQWMIEARRARASTSQWRTSVADAALFLDGYERRMRDAIRLASTRSDVVLVVQQPRITLASAQQPERGMFWGLGVGDPLRGVIETHFADAIADDLLSAVHGRAMAAVEAEGAVALTLPETTLPPTVEYFYDQFHLNEAGCEIVGRAVATRLRVLASRRPSPASEREL